MPRDYKKCNLEMPECSIIDFVPLFNYLAKRRKIYRDMKIKYIKCILTFKDGVFTSSAIRVKLHNENYSIDIYKLITIHNNEFIFNAVNKETEECNFLNVNKRYAKAPLWQVIYKLQDNLELYKGLAYRMLF